MALANGAEEALHRIRVRLYRSNLPGAAGAYAARTASEAALSIEEVCAALKNRGGSSAQYDDLVAHVKQFFNEAAYQLCGGFAVNTGYFTVQPVVGGFFDTAAGDRAPKEHPVGFSFRARAPLRRLARHIAVEVDGLGALGRIDSFWDGESGAVNGAATPGGLFVLRGDKIKVMGGNADVGVYFVPRSDPAARCKAAGRLAGNTCRKVIGRVPPLPAGEYGIEVKTQYTTGVVCLREPRTVAAGFGVRV